MGTTLRKQGNQFYHVCRYGLDNKHILGENWDRNHFITLMIQHLLPCTQPIAYSLLPDSYNILLYTSTRLSIQAFAGQYIQPMEAGYRQYLQKKVNNPARSLPKFLGSITQIEPYEVKGLICLIHQLPVDHQYCDHPVQWSHSSYPSILMREPMLVDPWLTSNLFGGIQQMKEAHRRHGKREMIQDKVQQMA